MTFCPHHHAEMHHQANQTDSNASPCSASRSYTSNLEVASSVDLTVRVMVLIQIAEWLSGVPLLPPDTIILGVKEVVLGQLFPLLLAPQSPCHKCNTTDQDRPADATHHATNDLLAG